MTSAVEQLREQIRKSGVMNRVEAPQDNALSAPRQEKQRQDRSKLRYTEAPPREESGGGRRAEASASGQPESVGIDARKVQSWDLTRSKRSASEGMPGLDIMGERFAASFRRTLAGALRQTCEIQPISTEIIAFRDFILQVPRPTGLFVFQLPPLPGRCAVVLDGQLLLALVDSLCGGAATDFSDDEELTERELTRIELRLLHRLAGPMGENLADAWEPIIPVEADFAEIVSRPELSRLADEAESVIFSVFEIHLGDFRSPLAVILPMSSLEPVRERLLRLSDVPGHVRSSQPGQRLAENLPEVPVELAVELGRSTIDVRTLLGLTEGDILKLDTKPGAPMDATVEGQKKFRGRPEAEGSSLLFHIESIIS